MIGMLSAPFLSMIGLIAYKHALMGAMSVFSISVVLVGFWFVIALLENPTESVWIDERTPADWKTADIDTFFHFGAQLRRNYQHQQAATVRPWQLFVFGCFTKLKNH
jgi:hypothetical protein